MPRPRRRVGILYSGDRLNWTPYFGHDLIRVKQDNSMARNQGLLHVNLDVSDMSRSVQFYTAALGFVLVSDTHPSTGTYTQRMGIPLQVVNPLDIPFQPTNVA